MTKLYKSKSAAIRHAIQCLGAEWENEAFINETHLPGDEFIYSVHMKAPAPASRASEPVSPRKSPAAPRLAHSSIKGATARARAIAIAMKGAQRREVIAACVREGIASGTAATQYALAKKSKA